jgi:hypothetical protein
MPTNQNEKPGMRAFRELRERCVMPTLFKGWTLEKTLEIMREAFKNHPQWMMDNVMKNDYPKHLAKKQHALGRWSYGYCYYIAEVATLIFDAIPLNHERLFIKDRKKGVKKYATHWVLKIGGLCFDPEKDHPMRASHYSKYSTRGFTPQHPSLSAVMIYVRILECSGSSVRFDSQQQQEVKRFLDYIRNWLIQYCKANSRVKRFQTCLNEISRS